MLCRRTEPKRARRAAAPLPGALSEQRLRERAALADVPSFHPDWAERLESAVLHDVEAAGGDAAAAAEALTTEAVAPAKKGRSEKAAAPKAIKKAAKLRKKKKALAGACAQRSPPQLASHA